MFSPPLLFLHEWPRLFVATVQLRVLCRCTSWCSRCCWLSSTQCVPLPICHPVSQVPLQCACQSKVKLSVTLSLFAFPPPVVSHGSIWSLVALLAVLPRLARLRLRSCHLLCAVGHAMMTRMGMEPLTFPYFFLYVHQQEFLIRVFVRLCGVGVTHLCIENCPCCWSD